MINMEFRIMLISGRRQKEFNLLVKFYLLNWVGTWFFFILVFILFAQAKNCPFFESLRQCLYRGGISKLGSYSPVSSLGSLWKQRPRQGYTQGACFGKWPHVTRWEQGRRESPSSCPGCVTKLGHLCEQLGFDPARSTLRSQKPRNRWLESRGEGTYSLASAPPLV